MQPIGNGLGIIIDEPMLSGLGITANTPLEISLTEDGKELLIRPIGDDEVTDHKARVRARAARVTKNHIPGEELTLKNLASVITCSFPPPGQSSPQAANAIKA